MDMKKTLMLKDLWDLLLPQERSQSVLLLILMFVAMVLEILSIGLVFPLLSAILDPSFVVSFQEYMHPYYNFLDFNPNIFLTGVVVGFFIVYCLKTAALAFIIKRQMIFVYSLEASLSVRLFKSYLNRDYSFHIQRNSSELIRNTISEVKLFAQNGVLQLIILIAEVTVLIGVICLLLIIDPLITVGATIIIGSATSGFYYLMKSRIYIWGEQRHVHDGLRIQHVQQGLGGIKDIKILGREDEFVSKFGYHTNESAKVGRLAHTLQQYPRLFLELIGVFIIVVFMITVVTKGLDLNEILPMLAVFFAAALRIIPSANRIVSAMQVAKFVLPVVRTIHAELFGFNDTGRVSMEQSDMLNFHQDIVLHDISFKYPGSDNYTLRNLNLTINRGDSIGFVGSSGAGKSTVIDLILGLLPPDRGTIYVDDNNIQKHLKEWQSFIGYVPQSIYLSDESLRSNIAYGIPDEDIDDLAVAQAINSVQLTEFVESLPDGVYSPVGERGVRMSGGQLQRLGVARAIYHDPKILVLDEATSALDATTEAGVMDAIRAMKGSKTVIIVAHRFSTVEHCDMIYKLQDGYIVNQGPPDLVLKNSI
jgi:ATP-binding cassette, subfamily B, bacterial PglK